LLNTYINRHTDFRSIFESSIGTSVNIKIKAINRCDPQLTRLQITGQGECIEDTITYEEFVATLSEKDQKDERKKEGYHTFLVFASGSIIMSSAGGEMPMIFGKLVKLLVENRAQFEEDDSSKLFYTDDINDVNDINDLADPADCETWLDDELGRELDSLSAAPAIEA
jgi:hypothetical protein